METRRDQKGLASSRPVKMPVYKFVSQELALSAKVSKRATIDLTESAALALFLKLRQRIDDEGYASLTILKYRAQGRTISDVTAWAEAKFGDRCWGPFFLTGKVTSFNWFFDSAEDAAMFALKWSEFEPRLTPAMPSLWESHSESLGPWLDPKI